MAFFISVAVFMYVCVLQTVRQFFCSQTARFYTVSQKS